MDVWQLALVGGAIAVALFWDRAVAVFRQWTKREPPPAQEGVHVGWSDAMDAVQVVRGRLVATGCLDDESKAAIETIVQALVQGSDK